MIPVGAKQVPDTYLFKEAMVIPRELVLPSESWSVAGGARPIRKTAEFLKRPVEIALTCATIRGKSEFEATENLIKRIESR